MKAEELRLNNLINIGGNTIDTYQTYKPTKVTLAILNEIAGENRERPDAILSVFQPIPLTEEWLLKSEYSRRKDYIVIDRFSLRWRPDYNYWYVQDNYSSCYLTKLEFVHEWQNFYYVMQGEELILNKTDKQ